LHLKLFYILKKVLSSKKKPEVKNEKVLRVPLAEYVKNIEEIIKIAKKRKDKLILVETSELSSDRYFVDEVHPSFEGNKLIAHKIFDVFQEHNLISSILGSAGEKNGT